MILCITINNVIYYTCVIDKTRILKNEAYQGLTAG